MQRIVDTARQLFRAHAAILFPYPDADSEATLQVREAVTAGVEETLRDQVIDWQLPIGDVTQLVMREGWLPVPDIRDTTQRLPEISRRILERLGAKSFEGLGLLVSGEKLAVLYLVHRQERTFSEAETRRARTFTTHAARALKKAKLLDQAAKRHIATMRAAELNAAAAILDLESTLNEIVVKTKEALQCDAVTLFVYNEETNHLLPLTTMIGVREPKEADHCEDASHDSIVYQMLKRDEPYYVARVANDSLFREQRFPRREEIESVCAIPLRLNEHRVGVMFINYRKFHPVSAAMLEPINPLIDQAAALILTHLRYIGQIELLGLSKQLLGARNLQESLKFAVKVAAATLVADFIAIVLPDEHGRFRIDESFGWTEEDRRNYEAYKGKEYQTEYTIEMGQPVIVPDYSKERRFKVHPIVSAKDIKCGMSVPMMSGNEPIGAILAHFLSPRPLIEAQTRSLSLLANLTAIAVQHHRAVQSKIASLSAVIFAADEISKIRMGTEHKQVLDTIVEQAVECIPQSFLGTIQTYDKEGNTLRLESVYPEEPKGTIQKGTERRLDRSEHSAVGITGRAVITGKPQLVPDVKIDPDYFPYGIGTQSELAVPLLDERDKVLGVLNVESRTLGAFNEDDKQALCALAKLVVATIQNAEQYRLLELTQRQAVSSTLLAWFGMASSVWGHSVTGNALTIEANVDRLRRKLKAYTLEPGAKKLIDDKLEVIDEMAAQIQEKPITALLHSAEGLSDIDIHALIYERLEQRWRQPPYDAAHYEVNFAPGVLRVRCHPEWLKRMLDILVHNALDAMSEMGSSRVSISTTTVDGGQIEIAIADHGRGIPMEVREKLFKQRIEQSAGSKGLGTGLLMAQVIAQAYRGAVAVARTDETGTTMSVRLPKVPEN
jgi:GAF domain-containing protein